MLTVDAAAAWPQARNTSSDILVLAIIVDDLIQQALSAEKDWHFFEIDQYLAIIDFCDHPGLTRLNEFPQFRN
jgi:hypothetical protein